MIGRIVWFVIIVALALVTVALQLDRQSGSTSSLAASVPEPFRAFAQAKLTSRALRSQKPQEALAEARKMARRRPVPAQSLRYLAIAQARTGDELSAAQTIQVAGRRGWRDRIAQETIARMAIAAQDYDEGARRYMALFLMRDKDPAMLKELGEELFKDAGGEARHTVSGIVAGSTRWRVVFLRTAPGLMPADAVVEIANSVSAAGVQWDCRALTRAAKQLDRDEGATSSLTPLVQQQCPR